MKRFLLLAALLACLAGPAFAADNFAFTPGSGSTMAAKDIGGGVLAPKQYMVDGSGNPCIQTIGSAYNSCGVQMGAEASGLNKAVISCDSHKFVNISSATDTLLVQGVSAKTIYICGYTAFAGGTNSVYLENTASTNANCVSTLTQITGTVALTAQTGIVDKAPFWSGLANTNGNGLCANSNGTGAVSIDLYYTQF